MSTRIVLCLGDSLTAGYGLPASQAYPTLLQAEVDAIGLGYRVRNAGLSGDTSGGALLRLPPYLDPVPHVAIVALGANDLLRMQPLPLLDQNLRQIVGRLRAVRPRMPILLVGLRLPPQILHPLARAWAPAVHNLFETVARETETHLVPDLLVNVAGHPSMNLADGLHPNALGHQQMARTLWVHLRPLLKD